MVEQLENVIGNRGESCVYLCLTEYKDFDRPLFAPGFLGDKWPTIDFYVELKEVSGSRPYFFVQAKATGSQLSRNARVIRVTTKKRDVERLLQIPGPTYILGVHEPSRRVFVRSVHRGVSIASIPSIPISNELTSANLKKLHQEVAEFWKTTKHKPDKSSF